MPWAKRPREEVLTMNDTLELTGKKRIYQKEDRRYISTFQDRNR